MQDGGLTRRSLLAGAAAIAGSLAQPSAGLAALALWGPAQLSERRLGALAPRGATVRLSGNADLLAVQWSGALDAGIELRFQGHGGRWSRWLSAGPLAHGPDRPLTARLIGEPIWTGGSSLLQLRARVAVSDARLHLIDTSHGVGAHALAALAAPLGPTGRLARLTPVLAAGSGQPPIIARRSWAQGSAPPRVTPAYGTVRVAFVHHTQTADPYRRAEVPAMLRAIYAFHRYVNGWDDIGYNFVIDRFGRIFEARAGGIDEPVVGAHAGGYNASSTGVALLGTFAAAVPPAASRALARLLAWKLALHGVPAHGRTAVTVSRAGAVYSRYPANARVSLEHICGHRDGDYTDCPGQPLYRALPALRETVAQLAPRIGALTLALTEAAPPNAALSGTLLLLDSAGATVAPVAGAPIWLQLRSVSRRGQRLRERTVAQTSTDANGAFSLPVTVAAAAHTAWLRALCPGKAGMPVAVSEPLALRGEPSFSGSSPAGAPSPPAAAPQAG